MYYHQFKSISMLITEITIWRCMVHVCQHDYASFVFHTMAVKSPLTLISVSPNFNFIFCPKFLGILVWFSLKVPQQFIVLLCMSSYKSGDKKKLSMYDTFNPCSTSCYSCICSRHWKSHITCFCLNTEAYCNYITQRHIACRFYSKLLVFLWYILFENDSIFEEDNDAINC